jgi:hypothetical protein
MLQDVYERLLLRRLDPRWVGDELHVDVHGRRFMIRGRPDGLSVRTLATAADSGHREHRDRTIVSARIGIVITGRSEATSLGGVGGWSVV